MTNRQIETSREIRLWITGVIAPALMGGLVILAANPDLRRNVTGYLKTKIQKINNKFQKKEV